MIETARYTIGRELEHGSQTQMCAAQRVTGGFDKLPLKNKGPCDMLHLARAHSLLLFVEPRVGSMSRAAGLIYYVVAVADVPAPSVNLTENCERSYGYGYIFFFLVEAFEMFD